MSSLGWIKLHREIAQGDLALDLTLLGLWTYILIHASRSPRKFKLNGVPVEFPAGSLVIGLRSLADATGVNKNVLKKRLDYLCQRDSIETHSGHEGIVIVVKNWDTYQYVDNTQGTFERVTKDSRDPQQEVKNKKSKNTVSKFDLEEAYKRYPRKQGKTPGVLRLAAQIKTDEDYANLLTAIDNYSRCEDVKRGFIKLFSTFAGEWRDWVDTSTGKVAAPKVEEFKL